MADPNTGPLEGYRLYFLGATDHIVRCIDLMCEDDDRAVESAGQHGKAARFAMELWQGARMVKRFEAAELRF